MSRQRKFRLKPVQKEFNRIRTGYVLLLIVPLAIQILVFKLIKFSMLESQGSLSRSFDNFLGHVILQYAPLPILLTTAGLVIGLLLFQKFSPLGIIFIPLVLGLAGTLGASLEFVLDELPVWISLEFVEVIRMDVAVLLILAALFLPGLRYLNGKPLSVFIILIHVVTFAVGCIAAFDFGYFVETGSLADSFLLIYSLKHAGNAVTVLAHELDRTKIILLSLPLVLTLLPVAYRAISRARKKITRFDVHKKTVPLNAPLLLCTSAFVLFLPALPIHDGLKPIHGNTVVDLLNSLADSPDVAPTGIKSNVDNKFGIPSGVVRFIASPMSSDSTSGAEPRVSPKENLILIILESTGAAATSLYDSTMQTTPFLADLASKGQVVQDMSVVVPHTNKALVPILCGVYPKISQDESRLHDGMSCIPSLLAEHGYESAFFTPARLDFENKGLLLERAGFDEIFGDGDFDYVGYNLVNYFGREDQIVVNPIVDWVTQKTDTGKPFFLSYLSLTPHHDYTVPDRHEMVEFDGRDNDRNNYLNTLAYQDAILKQLFDGFEQAGILETTNVIIVGDHGEAFGEHGLRHHSSVMWQEVAHVPAVLLTTDGKTGEISGPRQQQDILQTTASMLGYEIDGVGLPGISLFDSVSTNRNLYMAGWTENQSMAMRTGSEKFIYRFNRFPSEWYNLDSDPRETSNLIDALDDGSAAQKEMQLLQWRRAVNDFYDDQQLESQ